MSRWLLKASRHRSFFLFGARGTGKTTYLRETFDPETALHVDLLHPDEEDRFGQTPAGSTARFAR